MKTSKHTKYLLLIVLFTFAFLERVVFDLGANIELVTTAIILSSLYIGRKETFWLTLAIMLASDRVIGNTSILLFTWSGFLIPALLLNHLFKKVGIENLKKMFIGTGAGLGTNMFFFLWTNFGVWLLDTWGMYPKTLSGLLMSYVNGLPFLKNQFLSSLVFIPVGITMVEIVKLLSRKYQVGFEKISKNQVAS